MSKKRGLMVIVTRPDRPPLFIAVETREEADTMLRVAELMGGTDVNGTPIEIELVEYEDTPL